MESMEELYQKHARMIYGFLLARTKDHHLAEELAQETFYQAVKSLDSFKGQSSASTWLCGIAENVWLAWCRKKRRQQDVFCEAEVSELEQQPGAPSAEDDYLQKRDEMILLRRLHEIKEPMREVMYLRIMGGLSFRDIGEIMGQSENWARVTFYRGKKKLTEGGRIDEQQDTL